MINKFTLLSLKLIGFRKNYEVKFKEGLNFISGPLSTGKSSIVELIDYALGKENHKSYIEIKKSCTDVELELFIGSKKYKLVRPLFDFKRPVKIYEWDLENQIFADDFQLAEIDFPSNEKSLSAFLLREIGLPNIKISNQSLSFRDLFKYSYINQSKIDSEDLLMEKMWHYNHKRKSTFEIIFGIYNGLLGELKQELKNKKAEINILENKRDGIYDFLKNLNLIDTEVFQNDRERIDIQLRMRKIALSNLKTSGKNTSKKALILENRLYNIKTRIQSVQEKIDKKVQYIEKLFLLRNQYTSDIDKIKFIIEGANQFRSFEFANCPSCLSELKTVEKKLSSDNCGLCGNKLKDLTVEEIESYKSEIRRITMKSNSLNKFVELQEMQLNDLKLQREELEDVLIRSQIKIDQIQSDYISPYIEKIEVLNYEIGVLMEGRDQIDRKIQVLNQFTKINNEIIENEAKKSSLEEQIKSIEVDTPNKDDVIKKLSELFKAILIEFRFPKLNEAYINDKHYLPYVRGIKYDELGSGGAVTMTTMAYFLAIALLKIKNKKHLGILIMDSPRKNLGADSKSNDEFKDETIFNSIIKYFMYIYSDHNSTKSDLDSLQLIIVSNGTPDYLDNKDIIVEFDGDGSKDLPYGLIDDIENL